MPFSVLAVVELSRQTSVCCARNKATKYMQQKDFSAECPPTSSWTTSQFYTTDHQSVVANACKGNPHYIHYNPMHTDQV